MPGPVYQFDRFTLDADNRRLTEDGRPVELSARYLDALLLLVREQGRLVSKTRFLEEVWRGVPVTDEALTQCIRALRRGLGDDAARPRFIETAPKHGYRFVAPVTAGQASLASATPSRGGRREEWLRLGRAGMLGAGAAGLAGGLFYGFVVGGGASGLVVVTLLCLAVSLVGGAGVSFGVARRCSPIAIAAPGAWPAGRWAVWRPGRWSS